MLRIYGAVEGGEPLSRVDLSRFLGVDADDESDFEGAARSGDRIYWVASHGRNKKGCLRGKRAALFATAIERDGDRATLRPVGRPYRDLIEALLAARGPAGNTLRRAIGVDASGALVRCDQDLAPKQSGLDIESLAAGPDGTLYIGLRNPTHEIEGRSHAIILRLLNSAAVVESGAPPSFAEPLFWYLGGGAPRSLDYCPALQSYLLVAGLPDVAGGWRLYRWSGNPGDPPTPLRLEVPSSFVGVEALAEVPGSRRVLLLTDDGTLPVTVKGPDECERGQYRRSGQCDNKHLRDSRRKSFRGLEIDPSAAR